MFKAIPLWLRIGVLLVLVVSAFLWWKVPQWRTENVLEEVEVALAERNFVAAQDALRELFRQHPRQLEVALRLAEVLRVTDPEAAHGLLVELHEAGRLPAERYPDAILLAYEVGQRESADAMYAGLIELSPNQPRRVGVEAVRLILEQEFVAGRERLEEALALFPDWHALRLLQADMLRQSPSKIDQLRAKEDLLRVAESTHPASVRALFSLVSSRNLAVSDEEKLDFLGRILEHPWANARLRLLAHHYRWVLEPDNREAIVRAAEVDLADRHPVMLAEWMNAIGEHERALALVPEGELVNTDLPAFEQRFRALAMGGRFEEAEELVETSQVDETAVQRAARLFLVSLRPDNSDEAVERWNEAYALARQENDLGVQRFLARSALRLGYLAGAVQAYEGLFDDPTFEEKADPSVWMEFFTVRLATGSLEEAHEVVSRASARYPDNLELANNQLYIELVSGMEWEDAYARFLSLAPPPDQISDVNGTGSTWVLSALLDERPQEALRQMEAIEAANPDQPISDSTKVVKALVLAANQRYEDALRLSREIDRERVLPAEWALLGNLELQP